VQYVKTGQLRALAVTSSRRLETLPDVPTVGETVPGYEASQWYGIGVPKATPALIVDLLNKEINAFLTDPKMKAKLVDLGGAELPGSPAEFTKMIADETEKWSKVGTPDARGVQVGRIRSGQGAMVSKAFGTTSRTASASLPGIGKFRKINLLFE
jgi:hypothetical protein